MASVKALNVISRQARSDSRPRPDPPCRAATSLCDARTQGAQPTELDMTTFLNLMVVLVPFLLITAVFSRITIVELEPAGLEPGRRLGRARTSGSRSIVRDDGLELHERPGDDRGEPPQGRGRVRPGHPDRARGRPRSSAIHPDSNDAPRCCSSRHIEYDHLIQVMDAVRSASVARTSRSKKPKRWASRPPAPARSRGSPFTRHLDRRRPVKSSRRMKRMSRNA